MASDFVNHRIRVNRLAINLLGGRAFIRYRRCLLPKTKGISNSDLKRWALFGLVDKVGIVSVTQLNTIWELCWLTFTSTGLIFMR